MKWQQNNWAAWSSKYVARTLFNKLVNLTNKFRQVPISRWRNKCSLPSEGYCLTWLGQILIAFLPLRYYLQISFVRLAMDGGLPCVFFSGSWLICLLRWIAAFGKRATRFTSSIAKLRECGEQSVVNTGLDPLDWHQHCCWSVRACWSSTYDQPARRRRWTERLMEPVPRRNRSLKFGLLNMGNILQLCNQECILRLFSINNGSRLIHSQKFPNIFGGIPEPYEKTEEIPGEFLENLKRISWRNPWKNL